MLTMKDAQRIINKAHVEGERNSLQPLCVVVLDVGGNMLALGRAVGASAYRPHIAIGKASACIGLGMGGQKVQAIGQERPSFSLSLSAVFPDGFVPARGGVLIRSKNGTIVGSVGITGDTSENDEQCAIAAIESTGFIADAGV